MYSGRNRAEPHGSSVSAPIITSSWRIVWNGLTVTNARQVSVVFTCKKFLLRRSD